MISKTEKDVFLLSNVTLIKGKTDFGNSKTKILLDNLRFYEPSTIEYLDSPPSFTDSNLDKLVANLMSDLVVHISSKSVKRNGLYSIGSRANMNAQRAKNMSITLGNKYAHDIPLLMDMSMTAAYAIQQHYKSKGKLPDSLIVEKELTGAIPASEFKGTDSTSKGNSKILEDRFTNDEHLVIVYVGNTPITVKINYVRAKITQEGVPALYGILEAKPKTITTGDVVSTVTILDHFKELYSQDKYKNVADRLTLTQRDLVGKRVLIIDIGAGTTEYIHAKNWVPVNNNCDGRNQGVGHAATRASDLLTAELSGNLKINRQRFDDILLDPTDNLHDSAVSHMENTMFSESESILETTQERYTIIGGDVDVFIVMGGGSIAFKDLLYDQLVEYADSVKCMVLWIPKEYAVDLNLDGLDVMHNKIFFKSETPAAAPKVNKAPSKREV